MDHLLVPALQEALGWHGPQMLGTDFAHGTIADTDLCSRLLTPNRLLDLVMRRSLTSDFLRCLVDGKDLHPNRYLGVLPARRGRSVSLADMERLGHLLKAGCTLVVDTINIYDPTMEVACRALQWWSHEIVKVNTYLTTGTAEGFTLHWDDHDVIVVQLTGEKSWEVRGLSRTVLMYRDAVANREAPSEVVWSGTMRTGDVMHIPRGYWHQATRRDREDGFSLHATFGFTQRTGVDWMLWLADRAREDSLFRHDLDRWGSDGEQSQRLIDAAKCIGPDRTPSTWLSESRNGQRRDTLHHTASSESPQRWYA